MNDRTSEVMIGSGINDGLFAARQTLAMASTEHRSKAGPRCAVNRFVNSLHHLLRDRVLIAKRVILGRRKLAKSFEGGHVFEELEQAYQQPSIMSSWAVRQCLQPRNLPF